jgi:AraC-like DNA-binding protein/mannose-6-phosphate isomerase-like protein (cupin superfamily)
MELHNSNPTQLNSALRLSTDDIPMSWRREWLCEVIGREYANVDITPPKNDRLFNEMNIYSGESMRLSIINSNSITIQRLPREPHLISQDAYFGVVLLSGEYLLEQNNREVFLKPGDMTIYDATRPHRIYCPGTFSKLLVSIPRNIMRERLAGVEHCNALHIPGTDGVGSVASRFLQSTAIEANKMSPVAFDSILNTSLDLLTLALNSVRPQNYNLTRSRSLSLYRIKEYIARNIANPLLDTAKIESGTGLSARYMNELFQDEEISLMRYVWNTRLEICYRRLASPNNVSKQVSEIALEAGFNDFSHFSRAFKKKFGISPREVKHTKSTF